MNYLKLLIFINLFSLVALRGIGNNSVSKDSTEYESYLHYEFAQLNCTTTNDSIFNIYVILDSKEIKDLKSFIVKSGKDKEIIESEQILLNDSKKVKIKENQCQIKIGTTESKFNYFEIYIIDNEENIFKSKLNYKDYENNTD